MPSAILRNFGRMPVFLVLIANDAVGFVRNTVSNTLGLEEKHNRGSAYEPTKW
jgi:hypothetical protein